tara:strand:- start:1092 stop:1433 length:342 start_codon:yes stop_codon:yes gene_type:complete
MTYKLQEEVFLDKFNKCYIKILTLNKKPENSPLKDYVKELPRQKLSPFDYDCHCKRKPHCLFAIIHPNNGNFIQSDEIEIVVDLLIESNYNINYPLTKLVKKNNETLMFYFSK